MARENIQETNGGGGNGNEHRLNEAEEFEKECQRLAGIEKEGARYIESKKVAEKLKPTFKLDIITKRVDKILRKKVADAKDKKAAASREERARAKAEEKYLKAEAKEAAKVPIVIEWSDLGNARRLVQEHGANIRYVHAFKRWYVWTGIYWKPDGDGEIMRLAEITLDDMYEKSKTIVDETRRTEYRKFILKSQSCLGVKNMVCLAKDQSEVVLSHEDMDADPMLLGVLNGTVDLQTGEFRESKREDYITMQCGVAFDAEAMCPEFEKFELKIAGGNKDLVAYKRRVFGVLLAGLMIEMLFILHGGGCNGKTTEMETLHALLGDYSQAADASLLIAAHNSRGATPEVLMLKNKRAVFINETDESDHLNESRVKYLTGDDTLFARGLYQDPVNFKPTHKPILRTNHKPTIRGTDLGIWRRISYIPYDVTISDDEKITDFRKTKLMPELPGILNWTLAGLKDYLEQGLATPLIADKATKEYRKEMDTATRWVEEACEHYTPPEGSWSNLKLKYLHQNYKDEVGDAAVSSQELGKCLRDHKYKMKVSGGTATVLEIRLRSMKGDDGSAF